MRFPWLQVGADVISAKAGDLGVLLGCSRREAMGLLVDLWTWVLTRSPDDTPPDGIVRDSRTGTGAEPATERAVSWAGPEGMLVTALEELGFVERLPNGLRFRGIERYAATWEKNRRRKQTAPKPERNRTGTGGEPARKTQTHIKDSSSAAGAPGGQVVLLDVAKPTEPVKPKPPRKQPDTEHHALWRALEAEYQRVMGHPYAVANSGADATAVKWLRTDAKATETESVRRWGNLLEWSKGGFPSVTGFVSLRQHWNAPQVLGSARNSAAPPAEDEKARLRRETWERIQREKQAKAAGGAA